ncbi:hypothetical protein ABBQ32_013635 [Trebouxia sp. C0010 RCD-2024]
MTMMRTLARLSHMAESFPWTLHRMVVVGLTDLLSITLILVRLDLSDGNEHLSFDMSSRLPEVQLLNSEPQRLFVELPDLGASFQVVGLLGFGATSHLYEAFEGGEQALLVSPTWCMISAWVTAY